MSHHTEILGGISPTVGSASRVADIVAALAPPPIKTGEDGLVAQPVTAKPKSEAVRLALGLVPGVAGAGVGAVAWKKHRVLGALAGHAIGDTAYPLLTGHGEGRKKALCQLGVEGAGVAGALAWKKRPYFGWALGLVAGAVATSFVPGSGAKAGYSKFMSWYHKK